MTDEISPPPSPQPEVEAPWLIGQRNIFLSGLSHITHAAFSTEYANLHFSTSDLSPQLRNVEQAVTAVKQIVCGDTTRPIQQYLEDSGLPFVSSDPRIQAAAVYDMANAALRFRETPPEIKRAIVTMRVMTDLESDDPEVLSWVLDGISPGEDNKGTLDESMIGEDLVAEFHKPLVDRLVVLYQSDLPDALHRKIAPLLSRYLPESPAATEDEVLYKHIWETCVQSPTNGEAYLLGMAILGRFQNPNISYKSVVEDIARLKDVRDGYAPRALWPVFYFTFNHQSLNPSRA